MGTIHGLGDTGHMTYILFHNLCLISEITAKTFPGLRLKDTSLLLTAISYDAEFGRNRMVYSKLHLT
jgi:hypothetical protein